MPFKNSNDYITGLKPVVFPAGIEVVAVRFALDLTLPDMALNNIGQIGILPAGCIPLDVHVDATDLDNGASGVAFQVGILNAAGTAFSTDAVDGGAHWGNTTASNAAFWQRITANGRGVMAVDPVQYDRKLGLRVSSAPSNGAVGTIGVTLYYRAA